MTIFLIVSTLWPNGQHLRPAVMPRDNIFTRMVAALYRTDTPTNLWPSIHVYNSLGAHFAIIRSKCFEKKKGIRIGSLILASSIIMATMFIKQHSVFDGCDVHPGISLRPADRSQRVPQQEKSKTADWLDNKNATAFSPLHFL